MRSSDYSFENARRIVDDCIGCLLFDEEELSLEEAENAVELFTMILAYCKDNGIINNYNICNFEEIVCNLSEEYKKEHYWDGEDDEDDEEESEE